MELHEFLLARIGEDEAEAQGWRTFPRDVQCPCGLEGQLDDYTCFDGRLPDRLSITHVVGSIPPPVVGGLVMAGWQTQTLTHVLTREQTRDLWASREVTPGGKRVLAECEAKRRIVKMHGPTKEPPGGFVYPEAASMCRACGPGDSWRSRNEPDSAVPCATLRFLALPYADHPDYREEWRP